MIIPSLTKQTSKRATTIMPTMAEPVATILDRVMEPFPKAAYLEKTGREYITEMLERKRKQEQAVVAQLAEWDSSQESDKLTDHGLLVALGQFAEAIGVMASLEKVPIPQQEGTEHTPQEKLTEFLVGILGGIEYLKDLNEGDHPLVKDTTVAEAWGQELFAHYSGVSRTLSAADEETLRALIGELRQISEPYIQRAILEAVKQAGHLVIDVDLAGRPVSPNSTDYPESSFGYMADDIQKGYQLCLVSMVSELWQRLLLVGQRYPGRTLSSQCLQTAVIEMEEVLGIRPQRRVDVLQQRIAVLAGEIDEREQKLQNLKEKERRLWFQISQAQTEKQAYRLEVEALTARYQLQERTEKPHCRLAKARRKLKSARKRVARRGRELQQVQRRQQRQQQKCWEQQDTLLSLSDWLAHLEIDNDSNSNPLPIVLRIDAGFSTGPNLTWLIEMGYIVLTKAYSGNTATALRQQLPSTSTWTRVGSNAWAIDCGDYMPNDCPYSLQTLLVQYRFPDKTLHTTLFYYGESPPATLQLWFTHYNARQLIEAGIKEVKGVFTLKRHLVRSPIGMQIQEQLALFAANFVRWAAAWLQECLVSTNPCFQQALGQVKTLVHTAAQATARWVRNAHGATLIFAPNGPFAETTISLTGKPVFQLALPLFSLPHF